MNFLQALNESQRGAVISAASRILCLAGAGTGKTRVLTHRVAHLHTESRIGTSNMLCLTFTRLAGKEMKERVMALIGEQEGKKLFCNTFHAFAVAVLRDWGYKLGIDPGFSIYDTEDRKEILQVIIKEFGSRTNIKKVLERFEQCVDVNEEAAWHPEECRVLMEYGYRLKQNNAVDLDRLIDLVNLLWNEHPDCLAHYKRTFTHVFVDEFQDTSDDQMEMLRLLDPENLFVVGDPDQAIYGWRNARIEYIVNFPQTYPGCEVHKLQDNYRSTHPIVDAANQVIKNNVNRIEKTLIAHKEGQPVETNDYDDEWTEIRELIGRIKSLKETGTRSSDIAILCRRNIQVDRFKNVMDQFGIPAQRIGGGDDPFAKRDVKAMIAWLDVFQNKKDSMSLKRAITFPKPYYTPNELLNFEIEAGMQDLSLYQILVERARGCFAEDMEKLRQAIERNGASNPSECFKSLIEALQLKDFYAQRGLENRKRDVEVAFSSMQRWEASKAALGEDFSLGSFLRFLRYRDIQEQLMDKQDAVKIMTVHASKGLEFPTVFVAGLAQGVFPSKKTSDPEEERRLFYVAVTRARDRLFLSWSRQVESWGNQLELVEVSQFVHECLQGQDRRVECG
ncbi:AAA family ATPase [Heliobacillus mobilis]|uniref:DNA 3'-5' helicase n=1 Tax=Heliobacterium mobile TaxID=28064 RepID=A0A6I3SBC9_HELMO|nr:ATP-dependent helicase [Heliobacterium mobile]MTV47737.1 AAA family ATPase [Heliobacterium mobile]